MVARFVLGPLCLVFCKTQRTKHQTQKSASSRRTPNYLKSDATAEYDSSAT